MKEKIILLIDDDLDAVELTRRALNKNNITSRLVTATDGREALNYLFGDGMQGDTPTNPLPHLILLDLKLPEIDGFELLHRLRVHPSTKLLPIVILSTSTERQDLIKSYELGCNSYICKPVNFLEFTEVIRQLSLYWLSLNQLPN